MENNNQSGDTTEKTDDSIFTGEDLSVNIYDKHIRQARNAIFTAAIVLAINLIILIATISKGYDYLWLDIAIWGVFILGFLALGFWTKKKPYYAIIGALILYAVFIILNAILDLSTLYKGIILKVIIVVLLVKGLRDAKDAQETKEQMGE